MIVFAYRFPHLKTQLGLFMLNYYGYKPFVILAPYQKLNHPEPTLRITPKVDLLDPLEMCKKLGFHYTICPHNESVKICQYYENDVGLILTARVLSKELINCFEDGIINAHPGLLPENRGLDNIKWAILNDLPQGVTTHYITEKLDSGRIIDRQVINVYEDDTLLDIHLRLMHLEVKMLINSIGKEGKEVNGGELRHRMTPEQEKEALKKFQSYKEKYK